MNKRMQFAVSRVDQQGSILSTQTRSSRTSRSSRKSSRKKSHPSVDDYETLGSIFDFNNYDEENPEYGDILVSTVFNRILELLNESHFLENRIPVRAIKEAEKKDSLRKSRQSYGMSKITLDELVEAISYTNFLVPDDIPPLSKAYSNNPLKDQIVPKYIKVSLRETDEITYFEQPSKTVPKESDEAKTVEDDNKIYDHLTIGRGKNRRKADAETQTIDILLKSRDINTISIRKAEQGSYVSNFDMFDTYKNLEQETEEVQIGDKQSVAITTYKVKGIEQFSKIGAGKSFHNCSMITQRCLAGNIYKDQQRRFRNMFLPDPLDIEVKYTYELEVLWTFRFHRIEFAKNRRAISCISWCPTNGDILAVSYGIYIYLTNSYTKNGYVCIWNIKNPVNPEHVYAYHVPVTCVEFCPFHSQLLAIGLFDGTVEIRDISDSTSAPVAVSRRSDARECEAVNDIKWIKVQSQTKDSKDDIEPMEIEPMLAITQSGTIMKYKIVNSPYLVGFRQMKLDNVVGVPEGIKVKRQKDIIEANRNPQGLALRIHPEKSDVYYALTDEGALHKCSINYPHQHMDLFQAHAGSVFCMEFSPWSPKLYLTCGTDWCIRIWLDGITHPLIELSSAIDAVNCAYWNPTNSTVIVSANKNFIEVWDIRKSILKPVFSDIMRDGASNTILKFSNCGRSVAVGDERGYVYICALENMPFPPHFQYQALESAIFKGIAAFPKLTEEVKNIGCFAYPNFAKHTDIF